MNAIKGVLFDLDGTLLDTIDDLLIAFNRLRCEHQLPDIAKDIFRNYISHGARMMVKEGFGITEDSIHFESLKQRFLDFYEQQNAEHTRFFPNMENVLHALETTTIPWGIVTNKHTKPTQQLLASLQIAHRPKAVVCGDTLSKAKPHPDPILHALKQMNVAPEHCLYVGDALTDALASQAAGTRMIVALYGYIEVCDNPMNWPAEAYIKDPMDLMKWISTNE